MVVLKIQGSHNRIHEIINLFLKAGSLTFTFTPAREAISVLMDWQLQEMISAVCSASYVLTETARLLVTTSNIAVRMDWHLQEIISAVQPVLHVRTKTTV